MDYLGGRKFLMAIICLAAAMAVEVFGEGLSVPMAGLIMGLYTTFSAANVVNTVRASKLEAPAPKLEAESALVIPPEAAQSPQPASAPAEVHPQVAAALSHLVERNAANEQASQVVQQSLANVQKTLVALLQTRQ